ncbi:hypothetical protein [Flavobacterium sp. CLA17]|uniref:hypothetical protein n=1 Tax=Flavobacterium sp. CLA17 TaxID=2724135 RepID=UPI001492D204|nr:hypothetical protein [Flavobacterium sp. CLA17]QSB25416.1 hypothetical protein HAV12_013645 [Flavobacterium sp. CLA17]
MEYSNLINIGYAISLYTLLFSTLMSVLELSVIPNHYFNFVYPKINSLALNKSKWLEIHAFQIIAVVSSGVSFFYKIDLLFKISFLILTVLTLYSYKNRTAGKDGADQLRMLALLAFSLCFLLDTNFEKIIALCFLGAQIILGYATSGIAKLSSPYWRKGDVLHLIFGTYSYGIPKIAKHIKACPKIERLMSHSAILVMLAVPVAFLIPNPYVILIALGAIFSFHFATAVLMGLNDFLYTFPLAYPGVILLHGLLHNYIVL